MSTSRVTVGWPALIAGGIGLLMAGGGVAYVALRPAPAPTSPQRTASGEVGTTTSPSSSAQAPAPAADVVITLTPEAIQRAGIVAAPVTAGGNASTLRLPGIVAPNAYKQVAITPLVGGRVTRVLAELGQSVGKGQTLAEIFSPELAEAETRFVSARAELDAHERELQRTEKLVEIGSASRQELERLHAEHAAKLTAAESAKSRLELLGLSTLAIAKLGPGKEVAALTTVFAPIAGVVTERAANPGLNVDTTAKLFTVVDLSTVWVVADLYEKDFSRVHVGASANVTTKAFPDAAQRGKVSYIDPQVNPETRTAKVRVEVANPTQELRLGMFADVSIEAEGGEAVTLIPHAAVQNVGNRTVVYVVDPTQPGRFTEREVRLGDRSGSNVVVLTGVRQGESVVSAGSFALRAERDRLGLRGAEVAPGNNAAYRSGESAAAREPQGGKILVTEKGYEPNKLTLLAGAPARITFVRTTDKTCGTEVVFPTLNIRRPLPLNEPVVIEFTPTKSGEIGFVCGTNMLRGALVVLIPDPEAVAPSRSG
jgi:membrane fusion protein, heavy metal efflux system